MREREEERIAGAMLLRRQGEMEAANQLERLSLDMSMESSFVAMISKLAH